MRRKALRSLAFGLCCALGVSVGAYSTVTATSTEVQRSGPRATAKAICLLWLVGVVFDDTARRCRVNPNEMRGHRYHCQQPRILSGYMTKSPHLPACSQNKESNGSGARELQLGVSESIGKRLITAETGSRSRNPGFDEEWIASNFGLKDRETKVETTGGCAWRVTNGPGCGRLSACSEKQADAVSLVDDFG
ncbi:hypothetical protein V8E51_014987 [Hyaloscypha variabilis]